MEKYGAVYWVVIVYDDVSGWSAVKGTNFNLFCNYMDTIWLLVT